MFDNKKKNPKKILEIISLLAIIISCVLLFPQARSLIVEIAEKSLGRELRDPGKWTNLLLTYSVFAILCFGIILAFLNKFVIINKLNKITNYRLKYIIIFSTCLFFLVVYLYLCFCIFRKVPFNSDMANMVLEANDIISGNFFLSDWVLTGILFLTTDLLFFILGSIFYGISVNTYYVAIILMFFTFSLSSLLLFKWKGGGGVFER